MGGIQQLLQIVKAYGLDEVAIETCIYRLLYYRQSRSLEGGRVMLIFRS